MQESEQNIFTQGLAQSGLVLEPEAMARLQRYYDELSRWNLKINLVAKGAASEIIERHFLDSLTLAPLLLSRPLPGSLLDVGTGAGFPGLVLKAVFPELPVTLVEPRLKRVSFLKHVIRTLGLKSIEVLAVTLNEEKVPAALDGRTFSLITSRALNSISEFLRLTAPLSPIGGLVLCMKGPKAQEEIESWQAQSGAASPYRLSEIIHTELPLSHTPRHLVIFSRIK